MFKTHRKTKNTRVSFRIIAAAFCCGFFAFGIHILFSAGNVGAIGQNLEVKNTGWNSLSAPSAYIEDLSKLSIANALAQTDPGYGIMPSSNSHYATVKKKDDDWNTIGSLNDGDKMIAYVPNSYFPNGETNYTGENITIKWKGIAQYDAGSGVMKAADVEMIINNLYIKTSRADNTGAILLADYHGTISYFSHRRKSSQNKLGARYNVIVHIYDTATQTRLDDKTINFGVADLDHCDLSVYTPTDPNTTCDEDASGDYSGISQAAIKGNYAEGVTFLSGVIDNDGNGLGEAFIENPSSLMYFDPDNTGTNARFVGTAITDNTVPANRKSGVAVQAKAGDFRFQVSGFNVTTENGLIPLSSVETGTAGPHAGEITITPSDYMIPWRDNRTINISVNAGYRLSKLVVDGQPYANISSLGDPNNGYEYNFSDITFNHTIVAYAEPIVAIEFCKQDMDGNIIPGVDFETVFNGDFIVADAVMTEDMSPSGSIISMNTDASKHATDVAWRSQTECVKIAVENINQDATYTGDYFDLSEVAPPDRYKKIDDVRVYLNQDGTINTTTTPSSTNIVITSTSITIKNELSLIKLCKENEAFSYLSGAEMELASLDASSLPMDDVTFEPGTYYNARLVDGRHIKWVTISDDCIGIIGLPNGTYDYIEKIAPLGYETAESIRFVISNGEIISSSDGTLSSNHLRLTMTDKLESDKLTVIKTLKGAGADTNKSFDITLTLSSSDSAPIPSAIQYTLNRQDGTSTSGLYNVQNGRVSFSLKGGESIDFTTNHKYDYSVTETNYSSDGYATSYINQDGKMTANTIVTITNTKGGTIITGIGEKPYMFALAVAGIIIGGFTVRAIRKKYRTQK